MRSVYLYQNEVHHNYNLWKVTIMELKNLIVESKTITVEHPTLEGFSVEVNYMSRDKVKKITDRATTQKYDKKTHRPVDKLDSDLFLQMYVKALITGWSGLTLGMVKEIAPVDLGDKSEGTIIEYSEDNALLLMKSSPDFDVWLSTVVEDVVNFNKSS